MKTRFFKSAMTLTTTTEEFLRKDQNCREKWTSSNEVFHEIVSALLCNTSNLFMKKTPFTDARSIIVICKSFDQRWPVEQDACLGFCKTFWTTSRTGHFHASFFERSFWRKTKTFKLMIELSTYLYFVHLVKLGPLQERVILMQQRIVQGRPSPLHNRRGRALRSKKRQSSSSIPDQLESSFNCWTMNFSLCTFVSSVFMMGKRWAKSLSPPFLANSSSIVVAGLARVRASSEMALASEIVSTKQ